ncbi:MAG: TIGR00270 family protein [Candidatus Bathyarchaeota archaeon]|nr:MAG: TIGR00270 family protein [Candidatus Bathyarchaeota archaeon]
MECEICGKKIFGKAHRSIVDSAKLFLCSECSLFASSSWKPQSPKYANPQVKTYDKTTHFSNTRRQRIMKEDLELVKNYSQRIRKGREQYNFSHEEFSRKIGEKISVLQKLETGKMIPDHKLAKKLENFLKIKLLEQPPKLDDIEEAYFKNNHVVTLGDIAIIQKPKKTNINEKKRS